MNPEEALVYLASCAVRKAVPDRERLAGVDLEAVRAYAASQMMSVCASLALESAGLRDETTARTIAAALQRQAAFEQACAAVTRRMEEAGIWYAPLKGTVLKKDYPVTVMREMSDCDFFYDASRSGDLKAIMEELGFTAESVGITIHDVYHKPPCLSFEMHTALFGTYHPQNLYTYYRHAEERLVRGKGFARSFTPEDFYLHLIAHEYKHYIGDGTGLRSLLDVYVYLKKHGAALDFSYIGREAEKLGIAGFERVNRALALHLFDEEPISADEREMLSCFLTSGVYGSFQRHLEHEVRHLGNGRTGKLRYILSRLFLPMETIKNVYPLIYKTKVLIPFFIVYRLIRSLLTGRETIRTELDGLHRIH